MLRLARRRDRPPGPGFRVHRLRVDRSPSGGGIGLSCALREPKDNPEMESFFGRCKGENRSLTLDAESLDELRTIGRKRIRYYNRVRRHSSLGDRPPWQSSRTSTARAERHFFLYNGRIYAQLNSCTSFYIIIRWNAIGTTCCSERRPSRNRHRCLSRRSPGGDGRRGTAGAPLPAPVESG